MIRDGAPNTWNFLKGVGGIKNNMVIPTAKLKFCFLIPIISYSGATLKEQQNRLYICM